jgi:ABC-type dipeptide/oligopeptide/nickel transport system permease component
MAARREPRFLLVPVRALLITFILTLLSFAVSLLLGIIGFVVYTHTSGNRVSLALAYRMVAFPTAVVVGIVVLAVTLTMETRRYRQEKTLAAIERAR